MRGVDMSILLAITSLILLLAIIIVYNKIINISNFVAEAWSGIDVQLKRRANLIPSLVTCVKSYKNFEQVTLLQIVEARSECQSSEYNSIARQVAEQQLTTQIRNLFALAEGYPELKSNENFLRLQSDLTDTENKIELSRRYYNGTVRDYNITIQKFPNIILAKMLGYQDKIYFEIDNDTQRELPTINMDGE